MIRFGFPNIAAEALHRYWCPLDGRWWGITGSVCPDCGDPPAPYVLAADVLAAAPFELTSCGAEWTDLIDGPIPPTRIRIADLGLAR